MAWVKVDDSFATHPKIVEAGNAAVGLWARAAAWSCQHLTDGQVPRHVVTLLGGRPGDVRRLVDSGLWTETDNGYAFHDWLDYQPSRSDTERRRRVKAEAGRRGAEKRWAP